jgi:subtilisin family serine protease
MELLQSTCPVNLKDFGKSPVHCQYLANKNPSHVHGKLSTPLSILRQAGLTRLMSLTVGNQDVRIAIIDGKIDSSHSSINSASIVYDNLPNFSKNSSSAIDHATFIASILVGQDSNHLGICQGCTLINIPIADVDFELGRLSAFNIATRIAKAIVVALDLGADVIQLSLEFSPEVTNSFKYLTEAIFAAAARGIRTVIAAGNNATLGSSSTLTTSGVIPVAAAGLNGWPDPYTALGPVIGTRGLLAPGVNLPGAKRPSGIDTRSGSSYSAAFVTGTFALLRSQFPHLSRDLIWEALLDPHSSRNRHISIVPPPLDADASLRKLENLPW